MYNALTIHKVTQYPKYIHVVIIYQNILKHVTYAFWLRLDYNYLRLIPSYLKSQKYYQNLFDHVKYAF